MYPVEVIPDADKLYLRIHGNNFVNGKIVATAFKEHGGGMSVNWSKYCKTANESRLLASQDPKLYGVVSFIAGEIRKENLKVEHNPSKKDRSHTDVIGVDELYRNVEKRHVLRLLITWEISTPNL